MKKKPVWVPLNAGFLLIVSFILGLWYLLLQRGFLMPSLPGGLPPHGHWMVGGFLSFLILSERIIVFPVKFFSILPLIYAWSAVFLYTRHPVVVVLHGFSLLGWWLHRYYFARKYGRVSQAFIEGLAFTLLSVALSLPASLRNHLAASIAAIGQILIVIFLERLEWYMASQRRIALTTFLVLVSASLAFLLALYSPEPLYIQTVCLVTLFLIGFRYDLWMRRKLKNQPISGGKFFFTALLLAYGWLALGGLALIFFILRHHPVGRDLAIHSLGLGFIFTMILAHAPMMIPVFRGVAKRVEPPVRLFWLFQVMTIGRLLGDVLIYSSVEIWRWTGLITSSGHIVLFFAYLFRIIRQLNGMSAVQSFPANGMIAGEGMKGVK